MERDIPNWTLHKKLNSCENSGKEGRRKPNSKEKLRAGSEKQELRQEERKKAGIGNDHKRTSRSPLGALGVQS